MNTLADGEYDTCPKHGPKLYMPTRRVLVTDNVVSLIHDEANPPEPKPFGWPYRFSVNSFFAVNVIFDKEKNRVVQ
ncbi:hypothetical protein MZD04_gp359 [Pseudomonas phage Psa21]|uniref:Uncharacterized protein n=1 Tax=Pseudomonas phage Psa21 TaxID=2530023 RepID=A0A481W5V0_9CAUD|nr:hypothetical protein MZD04_gp359 [Pseudomonas phage Psa21]QBJ02885.1 hypothetical protein PSA21_359 [Pseudomonas phage Psa21]